MKGTMPGMRRVQGAVGAVRNRTYKARPIPEPQVTVACRVCGREFDVAKSRVAWAKYCTTRCRLKDAEAGA